MNTRNVNELFISDGSAFNTDATNIAAITTQLNFVGGDMTVATGNAHTITNTPILYAVNKLANGDLKRSFPINGLNISGWRGESYAPAAREVWAIGYNRKTAAGTIEVNNGVNYGMAITFKWDKQFYSERNERLTINFVSAVNATQLTIATQITNLINNSAQGSQPSSIKTVQAVVVGDGTGAYGLTGAANYGVEVWALDINQFANTQYKNLRVYFSISVDDNTGFGTTSTCTQIQANSYGTGTLEEISGLELYNYQFEGVLNRTKWPIPVLPQLCATTLTSSGTLAAFTSATTIGLDLVTFSAAASTQLPAGSKVTLDGVAYEIKYYISTTVAILTTLETSTNATGLVVGKAGYDVYNISFNDTTITAGANVAQLSRKEISIASPAISGSPTSMATKSTSSTAIELMLNAWMTTTPLAPANVLL